MSSEPTDRSVRPAVSPEALRELAEQTRRLIEDSRELRARMRKALEERPSWDTDSAVNHDGAPRR